MTHVLAINGSPRNNGNTAHMIKQVLQALEQEGCTTETVRIGGTDIRGCSACYRCIETKDRRCSMNRDCFNDVFERMLNADAIILASPTYFADITPELKALIDRAGFVSRVNGQLFRHKVGSALVSLRRGGGVHAFDSINHLFQACGMFMVGSTYWNLGFGGREGNGIGEDSEGMQNMEDLAASLAYLLKKLHA
ncbi:flavodoxin family protein [Prosthecochloris sp. N3]|uniref:Flavodoxin family protein n=1 Tax=Prosthecochloris ethylica TaxID=2743976 RepID=A0ABR9XQG4_9CHLB|nr:flavodoxin family protein [Prosthecochloris ethylica]MBF0585444.1 flavodoxin family protein [Prosthecochloris ethylica]MBF0636230.1 flavodoxin family protein [Prosthecochloris ethylica]NUK46674.1 flavodoxin family protein [Prosthecochloris ethylica]